MLLNNMSNDLYSCMDECKLYLYSLTQCRLATIMCVFSLLFYFASSVCLACFCTFLCIFFPLVFGFDVFFFFFFLGNPSIFC